MAFNHDYVALDWIRGEIDSTLTEAQTDLEAYVNEPQDTSKLRFCLNHLHQIHGTLQMVEFYGAAVMAEEMEKLTVAIIEDKIANRDEALEVLMESMLQLPNYLERLRQSRQDLPLILMPSLNDLRAARGEALLTDNALFNPDLSHARRPITGNTAQRLKDPRTIPQLRKVRQMYQFALVGLIREKEVKTNLEYMHKSLHYLEGLTRGTPHEQLWRTATGLIEAFEHNQIDLSIAIKSLLRNVDLLIKKAIDEPQSILSETLPEDTLKHLLYYVACASPVTPRIQTLRVDYKLDEALPDEANIANERDKLNGPDMGALFSVSAALAEELNRVKDELDLFMRSKQRDPEDIESQMPALRQISNTMTILGMGQPRKLVDDLLMQMESALADGQTPSDDELMGMASLLLQAEVLMSDADNQSAHGWNPERYRETLVPKEQLIDAHEAVIQEARNSIEQAKLSIVEFIGSQWDMKHIMPVPQQLRSIEGGLSLIPLEKAANLLRLCADFIQNRLIDEGTTPDWTQLDTLADAVTSIEYYLERMADGGDENPALLEVAEEALAHLVSGAMENIPELSHEQQPVMAADKEADTDLIDDEIREIFVEEAGEVINSMLSCFPRWNENPSNSEALTELRRAFHTLKGSGRLVGATAIGELSWSVENLLNKVIEGSLESNLAVFELTEQTIYQIPKLVAAFSQGRPMEGADGLIEQAQALAAQSSNPVQEEDLRVDLAIEEDVPTLTLEESPVVEGSADETGPSEASTADEAAPPAEPIAESEDDLIDAEILEVFVEEAGEVCETLNQYLPRFVGNYDDQEARTEMRRAFHTLKGSGRMVGATDAGELAWSIENLLNRVLDDTLTMTPAIAELVQHVVSLLPDMVEDFEQRRASRHDTEACMAHAHAIATGKIPPDSAYTGQQPAEPKQESLAGEEQGGEELSLAPESPILEADEDDGLGIDPGLRAIFQAETETHLEALQGFIAYASNHSDVQVNDDLSRALHTLKGSANTAGVTPISTVVTPTEKFFKEARSAGISVDPELSSLLADTVEFIRLGLAQLNKSPLEPLPGSDDYLERLEAMRHERLDEVDPNESLSESSAPDPQLLNLFLTEGIDILLDADRILDEWRNDGVTAPEQHQLVTELQTLSQGAQLADLGDVQELADALEKAYRCIEEQRLKPDGAFFELARDSHEQLINMMDEVAAGLATTADSSLIPRLQDRVAALPTEAPQDPSTEEVGESPLTKAVPEVEELTLDDGLADIFLEEASDLIDSSAETLSSWLSDRHSQTLAQSLQRDLHTLNGGARLAGQHGIASLAHELERLFEKVAENTLQVDDEAAELSSTAHDTLTRLVLELQEKGHRQGAPEVVEAIRTYLLTATQPLSEPEQTPNPSEFINLDDLGDLDEETLSLFLEEAQEILDRTADTLQQWQDTPNNPDLLSEIQRDLHTFKGGARLAQVGIAGDLAHEMETLLEALSEGRLSPQPEHGAVLIEAHDRLNEMTEALIQRSALPGENGLVGRLQALAKGLPDPQQSPSVSSPAETTQLDAAPSSAPLVEGSLFELDELDSELVELFLSEAEELTHETASQLHQWQSNPNDSDAMKTLLRALHTLKGGARLAEIRPIGDLAHALETLLEGLVEGKIAPSEDAISLTNTANDALVDMIDNASQGQAIPGAEPLIQQIEILSGVSAPTATPSASRAAPPQTREPAPVDKHFLANGRETLARMLEMYDQWQLGTQGSLAALKSSAASLAGQSRQAQVDAITQLAEALQEAIDGVNDDATAEGELPTLVERSLRYSGRLFDQIQEGEEPNAPNELIQELAGLAGLSDGGIDLSGIDDDILQVFIEEADELLGGITRLMSQWQAEPGHLGHPDAIQRQLHTLKGGARLAMLPDIGDLAQELEAIAKDACDHEKVLDDGMAQEMEPLLEKLSTRVAQVKEAYRSLQLRKIAQESEDSEHAAATEKVVQMQRQQSSDKGTQKKAAPKEKKAATASNRQAAQDTVRVASGLLDNLVNLAGETSITRGLMEQQISDFSYTLVEMQATTDRLREQLRRMDIETEAQVLFRMEQEVGTDYEDFDPLEMDRYSSIQQLSRALSESASDLTDLRETMLERLRGTETLLLQQARVNTELQEGLMQTRMVPFTSIVPRLRRIVRQVSSELGKKANFEVFNPEGELDRTVLERMVAPLEHMLRNALDHGVEMPAERKAAGKNETGTIRLSLSREGGDVVIVLEDDGGGINVEAIRRKALKQGLMEEGQSLADHEVLQLIFHAGLSTAEKVTQISGRGVGMDVVSSEIKQLGGRVNIESSLGQGSRFTVHLPFTVSVNRALMVSIGEDYYAIPLNTIEGIVRVSTYELEEYYKPDSPDYEYAGQKYRLQYLGSLLNSDHHPKLHGQALPLPVILVRGGDSPLALQVDSLMGSREIVVKGLGKQFAGVRGVSGATILGDGSVVIILDLPAMIRNDISLQGPTATDQGDTGTRSSGPKTVMVVDDSVTVRKVTSRLLERHGMEVLTAKDGVDAIALLQDHKPDLMLLDIEMPRMDGFEVASLVRHDSRLSDVPIIMITSRTGQKHRERALAIGVNEYMGKPFQENKLLETIEQLTES